MMGTLVTLPKEVDAEYKLIDVRLDDEDLDECAQCLMELGRECGVAEVFSPPKVSARAWNFGVTAGFALDLTVPKAD